MKPRECAVALVISFTVCAATILPASNYIQGYSLDVLFALRNLIAPPRIDFAKSPIVIVAIDEKTYRTEPFEGTPKVFWTKQIAKVIDALLEAEVRGFWNVEQVIKINKA